MFGRRKRERERGRQAAKVVFAFMDEQEADSWRLTQLSEETSVEEAEAQAPQWTVTQTADFIQELLDACGGDIGKVMEAIDAWGSSRSARYEEKGDEDRAMHVEGVAFGLTLGTIGDLFGLRGDFLMDADRKELVDEGRRRGWRR